MASVAQLSTCGEIVLVEQATAGGIEMSHTLIAKSQRCALGDRARDVDAWPGQRALGPGSNARHRLCRGVLRLLLLELRLGDAPGGQPPAHAAQAAQIYDASARIRVVQNAAGHRHQQLVCQQREEPAICRARIGATGGLGRLGCPRAAF